jgi:hypothetical protein
MIHRRKILAALAIIALPVVAHGQPAPMPSPPGGPPSVGPPPDGPPPSGPTPGWSSPRPSANAAATTRDTTTAAPWSARLALETRSLALEWPSLGLGSGQMVVVACHPHRRARCR